MSKKNPALFAWLLAAAMVVAVLLSAVTRPTHWERTALVGLVLALVAAAVAVRISRNPRDV
jgi:hypothetical protein